MDDYDLRYMYLLHWYLLFLLYILYILYILHIQFIGMLKLMRYVSQFHEYTHISEYTCGTRILHVYAIDLPVDSTGVYSTARSAATTKSSLIGYRSCS